MIDEFAFDNCISEDQQNAILDLTTHSNFSWNFAKGTILPKDVENNPYVIQSGINPFQFTHIINLQDCPYVDILIPIADALTTNFNSNIQVIKAKFNLLTQSNNSQYHLPHTDIDDGIDDCYTALYYVNSADGDTYLFNEFGPKTSDNVTLRTKITPEKGKLVIFKANRFHSSSSPVNSDVRIVMNVVFKINKGE
jgi:hypothetical protein